MASSQYIREHLENFIIPGWAYSELCPEIRRLIGQRRGYILHGIVDRRLSFWRHTGKIECKAQVDGKQFPDRFLQREIEYGITFRIIKDIAGDGNARFRGIGQPEIRFINVVNAYPGANGLEPYFQ